jgi:uncharacterized membrane protein
MFAACDSDTRMVEAPPIQVLPDDKRGQVPAWNSRFIPMTKGNVLTAGAVILSLLAVVVSFNLLARHMTGTGGPAWFDAGCSDDPNSAANCGAVLASPYAYWPVKHEGADDQTKHLPVALLGLFYYSALAVWFLTVGRPSYYRRWVHLLPLMLVTCGLIGSAYYIYIMFARLDHWCLWCAVTHVINLCLAVVILLLWPKGPPATTQATEKHQGIAGDKSARAKGHQSPAPGKDEVAYPAFRHVLAGLFAALVIVWGQYQLFDKVMYAGEKARIELDFQQCVQIVNKLKADPGNLLAAWERETQCDISIGADEPVRTNAEEGEPTMYVVAFSDLECPSCKRFADFFERDIQPLFDHKLSLVFKHHPLDSACNTRLRGSVHPHACQAAKMIEAACELGGAEKFWLAHDHLFSAQNDLAQGKINAEWLAARLQLDPGALQQAMESSEVAERIRKDIAQAAQCKVAATPTVFVDGRLVDTVPRNEIAFWDRLADEYWQRAGTPRPEHTKRGKR